MPLGSECTPSTSSIYEPQQLHLNSTQLRAPDGGQLKVSVQRLATRRGGAIAEALWGVQMKLTLGLLDTQELFRPSALSLRPP